MMYAYFPGIQRAKNEILNECNPSEFNSESIERFNLSFSELMQLEALQKFNSHDEWDEFIDKYESIIGTTIKSSSLFDEEQIDCEDITTPAGLVYHCYYRWKNSRNCETVDDFLNVSLNNWEQQVLKEMLGVN